MTRPPLLAPLAGLAASLLVGLLATPAVAASRRSAQPPEQPEQRAATAEDFVGLWFGTLVSGPQKLRLSFAVERTDEGLAATWSSHDQGAEGLGIDRVALEGREITFVMRDAFATYTGELSPDGERLIGNFKQGRSFQLDLDRVDEIPTSERPQTPRPPFPYREIEVRFGHFENEERITLAGTLTIPDGEGPFPVAVLISGSGPQDRDETLLDHKPFWVLADHLSRRGIAVLRYDDRGTGQSSGDHSAATTLEFCRDAASAAAFLGRHGSVRDDAIGLIGHSEGALIASKTAKLLREEDGVQVAFCVLIAGPAVPGREILAKQHQLLLEANGVPQKVVEENGRLQEELLDIVSDPSTTDPVDALRKRATEIFESANKTQRELIGAPNAEIFADLMVARLGTPWMRTFLSLDPGEFLRSLSCPVLAIFGAKDLQVPATQNAPVMRRLFEEGKVEDATVEVLEGLNHLMQHSETGNPSEYASIEESFAPVALDRISDWIRERFVAN